MGEATQRLAVAGSHSRLGLEGHREEVASSRGLPGRIRAQEAGCWQEWDHICSGAVQQAWARALQR